MTDTLLSLFDEGEESLSGPLSHAARPAARPVPAVRPAHERRIVADSSDRIAWLRARSRGITATDVAKLSTPRSVDAAAREKWYGSRFSGNAFTEHGKQREPEIAAWMLSNHGIAPSSLLFHAEGEPRHLATPDGLTVTDAGGVLLAEIKTTNKPWRSIPRHYLRQIWWQQYVLGAERTLFVWERHEAFVPVGEPECRWVDRDENEITTLVGLARQLVGAVEALARAHRPMYDR
jgi:hypothetical protein